MNSASLLIVAFAAILIPSNGQIIRPDAFLASFETLEDTVSAYQATAQEQLAALRAGASSQSDDYYNSTLEMIETNINNTGYSDTTIRASLTAMTLNACVTNLLNFLDSIIELSGYAISNCIIVNNSTANSSDFETLMSTVTQQLDSIDDAFIQCLVGYNVFTQPDDILTCIDGLFTAAQTAIDASIAELEAMASSASSDDAATMQSCFADIDTSVASAYDAVQTQMPVCAKFGIRARTAIVELNPYDYFPQLH